MSKHDLFYVEGDVTTSTGRRFVDTMVIAAKDAVEAATQVRTTWARRGRVNDGPLRVSDIGDSRSGAVTVDLPPTPSEVITAEDIRRAARRLGWKPLSEREPRKPRIILRPGRVRSKIDGQEHTIVAGQLRQLYRLTDEELNRTTTIHHERYYVPQANDIVLRPRVDGDYSRVTAGLDPRPYFPTDRIVDAVYTGFNWTDDKMVATLLTAWGPLEYPVSLVGPRQWPANTPLAGRQGWNRQMVRLDPPRAGLLMYWAPAGYTKGDRVVVPYSGTTKLGTIERHAQDADKAKLGSRVISDVLGKFEPVK